MKWSTNDGRYSIILTSKAWKNILCNCEKAVNKEIGGILIGYYTDDLITAIVKEATPPPKDSRSGYIWFYRGTAGLKRLLILRWKEIKRCYYLGEWHYHPEKNIKPSSDDINQMVRISREENYNCQEPILLIIGYDHGEARQIRTFIFPKREEMTELVHVKDS
ncbi:MAG: Mov34/MPN/PAD-1 family protein [Candidatus Jettenia sp.]|nr:MAG: Mov34/MPN/PAD-1 family protein [Candidatus Jettenia sp.]